jgi:exodeoxyribonuclease VII large subunit
MSTNQQTVYAVGEVTRYIKHLLEGDQILANVEVSGEISNLTYHNSGHVYFSIKDADAQLSCVMFRTYAQQAERLQRGDQVIIGGSISVYAPRGNYQMMVRHVRKAGVGGLFQQFLALKEKLQKEGLFEKNHKKPIPVFPQHIGVLTSETGAAVRDIIRTLYRRYPHVKVTLFPTVVQGERGAASIIQNLKEASKIRPDVLILGRGGGSIEDLWNFNEEAVARAIFAAEIPIITGIGHETDFTIADFVSDLRASTPTAAAEHAVPDGLGVRQLLTDYQQKLDQSLQYFVDFKRQVLDDYGHRLQVAMEQKVKDKRHQLAILEAKLLAADMTKLLEQGYTLTLHEGKILRSKEELKEGDSLETIFKDGKTSSIIKNIE